MPKEKFIEERQYQQEIEDDIKPLINAAKNEEILININFRSLLLTEDSLRGLNVENCRFENCKFLNCSFEKVSFENTEFSVCDFSNSRFDESYFKNCRFQYCKFVGTSFYENIFKNLQIVDSNLQYVVFESSSFQTLLLENSDMNSGSVTTCRLKETCFNNVDFSRVNFFKTFLKGIDFSDSKIENIRVSDDYRELSGMTVDLYQAAQLSRLLGINVK